MDETSNPTAKDIWVKCKRGAAQGAPIGAFIGTVIVLAGIGSCISRIVFGNSSAGK